MWVCGMGRVCVGVEEGAALGPWVGGWVERGACVVWSMRGGCGCVLLVALARCSVVACCCCCCFAATAALFVLLRLVGLAARAPGRLLVSGVLFSTQLRSGFLLWVEIDRLERLAADHSTLSVEFCVRALR